MDLSRRELLVGGGALLASCRSAAHATNSARGKFEAVLAAHADKLPEAAGRGASHYPMAAEALVMLGYEAAIPAAWQRGAAAYAGQVPRRIPIAANTTTADVATALGDYDRFGDWLEHFDTLLAIEPWRDVVAAWAPQLAPGLSGALFHGAIRTAHAVRALRARATAVRHHELAIGLAYWAARYAELPVATLPARSSSTELADLPPPHLAADADIAFDAVMPHLLATPAPLADTFTGTRTDPYDAITTIGRDAAVAFLEMLAQERQRIWLLHTVTAPAAIALLLPEVDAVDAHRLVAHTRQAVVAMFRTFGAPFAWRASVRSSPPPWPELIARAANSNSVHTIKLVEALTRLDVPDDMLCRSVAAQWLEWR